MTLSGFSTDLYIPRYPVGRWGNWEIRTAPMIQDHGYYTGVWLVRNMPVLLRHYNGQAETWMSVSPHEIESQELACRYAFGHTVVMGLGMGWIAVNVALNPAVDKVTVIEKDPVIIDLFRETGILATIPEEAGKKVAVIEGDALTWRPDPDQSVDFIHADIWQFLAEAGTLDQVRRMQENIRASQIYIWGQELILYNQAKRQWPDLEVYDTPVIARCAAEGLALPLLVPSDMDYGEMVRKVVQNRQRRGLPMERR